MSLQAFWQRRRAFRVIAVTFTPDLVKHWQITSWDDGRTTWHSNKAIPACELKMKKAYEYKIVVCGFTCKKCNELYEKLIK